MNQEHLKILNRKEIVGRSFSKLQRLTAFGNIYPALLIFGYSPLYLPTSKEATARININQLLEDAGWQFFDDENGPAKIITRSKILMDEMGN